MKFVALVSGGKDSCFAAWKAIQEGHELVALANLHPPVDTQSDEMDSFMFQTVGYQVLESYGECFGVPMIRRPLIGKSRFLEMEYQQTEMDEVEDLFLLLKDVKERFPGLEAVSSGALFSDYQRLRVEHVCARLNLVSLAYLWRIDQKELLSDMVENSMNAILIKVAAIGLVPSKHLGKSIQQLYSHLMNLESKYGINICGEGGEYESLTLDCPIFKKRIVIDESTVVIHSDDAFAAVGYLTISKFHLEDKELSSEAYPIIRRVAKVAVHDEDSQSEESDSEQVPNLPRSMVLLKSSYENCAASPAVLNPLTEDGGIKKAAFHGSVSSLSCPSHITTDLPRSTCIVSETNKVMSLLKETLLRSGVSMKDVFYVNLYLSDMNDFSTVNGEYCKFFSSNPPSRTCVQSLLPEGTHIVLDAMFYTGKSKNVLHVQSISGWANACIGPYSQANKIESCIFLAGQIGLIPEKMILENSADAHEKCRLEAERTLINTRQILDAMQCSLSDIMSGILFVNCKQSWDTAASIFAENCSSLETLIGLEVDYLPRNASVEYQVIARLKQSRGESDSEEDIGCNTDFSNNQTQILKISENSFAILQKATSHSLNIIQLTLAVKKSGDENVSVVIDEFIKKHMRLVQSSNAVHFATTLFFDANTARSDSSLLGKLKSAVEKATADCPSSVVFCKSIHICTAANLAENIAETDVFAAFSARFLLETAQKL